MKRRSSHCRWIRKILALLLLSFCTASLVLMQANYSHITMLSSLVSHEAVDQKPKIAFLFIARNRLPPDLVWDAFFKGEKEGSNSMWYAGSSFADTKEGRYNPKMHPIIPVHNWRKGSQWAVLVRKHAKTMVNDDVVFPEFQKHCRPADAWKEHNCIPDEHYVQTLLART